jgi:hypothetical protein
MKASELITKLQVLVDNGQDYNVYYWDVEWYGYFDIDDPEVINTSQPMRY